VELAKLGAATIQYRWSNNSQLIGILNVKAQELFKNYPEKKEEILGGQFWDLLDFHASITYCAKDVGREITSRYRTDDDNIRKMKSINHLDFLSNEGIMHLEREYVFETILEWLMKPDNFESLDAAILTRLLHALSLSIVH